MNLIFYSELTWFLTSIADNIKHNEKSSPNVSLHDIYIYIEFIFKEYCNILLESSYIGYDDSNTDRKEILSDIMDKATLNHSFKDDLWMKISKL